MMPGISARPSASMTCLASAQAARGDGADAAGAHGEVGADGVGAGAVVEGGVADAAGRPCEGSAAPSGPRRTALLESMSAAAVSACQAPVIDPARDLREPARRRSSTRRAVVTPRKAGSEQQPRRETASRARRVAAQADRLGAQWRRRRGWMSPSQTRTIAAVSSLEPKVHVVSRVAEAHVHRRALEDQPDSAARRD